VLNAAYAFAGMTAELEKTMPLGNGETIIAQGNVRVRTWYGEPRSLLRLTNRRLFILVHRAFGPDRITVVPAGALQSADQQSGSWLTITFRGPRTKSDTFRMQSFLLGLLDLLKQWLIDQPPS